MCTRASTTTARNIHRTKTGVLSSIDITPDCLMKRGTTPYRNNTPPISPVMATNCTNRIATYTGELTSNERSASASDAICRTARPTSPLNVHARSGGQHQVTRRQT